MFDILSDNTYVRSQLMYERLPRYLQIVVDYELLNEDEVRDGYGMTEADYFKENYE